MAFALIVVLVLHAMTFWSLDAAVKRQLIAVRAEAGTLALSVAPLRVPDAQNAALVYQDAFEVMEAGAWPPVWRQAVEALEDYRKPAGTRKEGHGEPKRHSVPPRWESQPIATRPHAVGCRQVWTI